MKLKADQALSKCLNIPGINSVLDFGCGPGVHTKKFLEAGKMVTGVDIYKHPDFPAEADFRGEEFFWGRYTPDWHKKDLIWCSHVLEHLQNPIIYLTRFLDLGKWTCITVPPMKPQVVSGHINWYSMGMLVYHFVLAGYDMTDAIGLKYGYNISVLVKNKRIENFPALKYDYPDLETLKEFFPEGMKGHGFNGNVDILGDWHGRVF